MSQALCGTAAAPENEGIREGVTVRLDYTDTPNDGTLFDSSAGREPLEFVFGTGEIIPGLEEGLRGMKEGETKMIRVPAEEVYGPYDEEAVVEVPLSTSFVIHDIDLPVCPVEPLLARSIDIHEMNTVKITLVQYIRNSLSIRGKCGTLSSGPVFWIHGNRQALQP